MELPKAFADKMTGLIGEDEFMQYKSVLDMPRVNGLRANTLKISREELRETLEGLVSLGDDVPWCRQGMYFDASAREKHMPGRIPYYSAGLYYIQEPSAMFPAEVADIQPNEKVLDLCAAPGGKSCAIAAALKGSGLLVSNDINKARADTLMFNIELTGAENCIVTSEKPSALARVFENYFDKILIDAPCSGEGMFRKDPEAVKSWCAYGSETCKVMQRDILSEAVKMLKAGGTIIYSTCTFDIGENEGMMDEFLQQHSDFTLAAVKKTGGISDGIAYNGDTKYTACARLWPHRIEGEGHFTAKLVREMNCDAAPNTEEAGTAQRRASDKSAMSSCKILDKLPCEIEAFCNANLTAMPEILRSGCYYVMGGDRVYATRFELPNIDKLCVLRMGLLIGEVTHGRLKPSQQFVMSLAPDSFVRNVDFDVDSENVRRYIRGESVEATGAADGMTGIRVRGVHGRAYLLGIGSVSGGIIKNLYPKGWRRMM